MERCAPVGPPITCPPERGIPAVRRRPPGVGGGGGRGSETTIDLTRDEFRRLYEAHREAVHRFLFRLAGNLHDAEDLLQETFVTFWRKRAQYRGDGSLSGYLKRIGYRTFLNRRARVEARRPPVPLERVAEPRDDGAAVDEAVADREAREYLRARVEETLATLPPAPRDAFVLFRFEGMTVAEVADATGAPPKTVESRLKRANELLASRLRRHRDQLSPR